MRGVGEAPGKYTFFLLGLLLKLHAIVHFDEEEGLELGLVGKTLQLLDLQVVLRDILLLAVFHGSHSSHGLQPG